MTVAHEMIVYLPKNGQAHELLALVHMELGEHTAAVRECRKSISLGNDGSLTRVNLAWNLAARCPDFNGKFPLQKKRAWQFVRDAPSKRSL